MVRSENSLSMGVQPAQGSSLNASQKNQIDIPIWEKVALTPEEASAYSGIGINKIRDLTNEKNCRFVLWVGTKRLIKRKQFEQYIDESYSI